MAKKKTATAKKPTAAKKKTTSTPKKAAVAKKKPAPAKKATKPAAKKTPVAKKTVDTASVNLPDSGTHEKNIQMLPPNVMNGIKGNITHLIAEFQKISDNNLTALQRRRKIGAGIRNYGFIDKVSDLAEANPRFAQFFNINDLKNAIRNIEMCRDIVVLLQAFTRMISNTMMVYSDDAFTMSLIYYNMVKEMSRRGDPEAMEIFRVLQPFFRRPRRASAEPTAKELERDLHALLHGKKDGKIVVENISPKKSAGVRKVVDDVHKSKGSVKETAEEQFQN